jgi:hypothetical protein
MSVYAIGLLVPDRSYGQIAFLNPSTISAGPWPAHQGKTPYEALRGRLNQPESVPFG